MNNFIHFQDIIVEDYSTWDGKSILSFDIDWASDEQIIFILDIVEQYKVKCCFFVTHQTHLLKRMQANKNIELGIHPNFNPLIMNDKTAKPASVIIEELCSFTPNSKVLRSHSMTTSGRFLATYKNYGVKYVSNYLMYGVQNIKPFYQINGLIEVPVFFADDGYMFLNDTPYIENININSLSEAYQGIRVFNFHPIHIFNNNYSYKNYEISKNNKSSNIKKEENTVIGAFDMLMFLLKQFTI